MKSNLLEKYAFCTIKIVFFVLFAKPEVIFASTSLPQGDFFIQPQVAQFAGDNAIQGKKDFEKVRDIDYRSEDYDIARRVGHMTYKKNGWCSGFLVGPDLFMTNHHCVYNDEDQTYIDTREISIYMDYLDENNRGNITSDVKAIEIKDARLDYALLRLKRPLGVRLGWLELWQPGQDVALEEAKVIQHPSARSKEISRVDSKFTMIDNTIMHYLADTEPGSSGSPVFTKTGSRVIALHHAGRKDHFNEGIRMDKIWPHISSYLYTSSSEKVNRGQQQGQNGKIMSGNLRKSYVPDDKYGDLSEEMKGFLTE